jgi:hypothetical protein
VAARILRLMAWMEEDSSGLKEAVLVVVLAMEHKGVSRANGQAWDSLFGKL